MANKSFAKDLNRLIRTDTRQSLPAVTTRAAIEGALGSSEGDEPTAGGGSADVSWVPTVVASTDGLFSFEIMTDENLGL
ncbi:MAG: hypothetical protein COC24_018125 [Alphaproteobacteria bacterium]|nr:hypothetical protein [Alphaproteobacteria bacterium]